MPFFRSSLSPTHPSQCLRISAQPPRTPLPPLASLSITSTLQSFPGLTSQFSLHPLASCPLLPRTPCLKRTPFPDPDPSPLGSSMGAIGFHGAGRCWSLCLDTHPDFVPHPWAEAAAGWRGWRAAQGSADGAPPHSPPAQLPVSAESHLLGARHRAKSWWRDTLVGYRWMSWGWQGASISKSAFSNTRTLTPALFFQPLSTLWGEDLPGAKTTLQAHQGHLDSPSEEESCHLHPPLYPHCLPTAWR